MLKAESLLIDQLQLIYLQYFDHILDHEQKL